MIVRNDEGRSPARARAGRSSSPVYSGPMSGHSKWSRSSARRAPTTPSAARVFTKVAREIIVAARAGGGDPDGNYRLRLAIDKARSVNMPADNIKRAIEQATGGGEARAVRGDRLRGLRPGRRRGPRRGDHRQPQPHRRRGPLDLHQGRRPAGRRGRGGLAVRAARPDHHRADGQDPDEVTLPPSTPAPTTSTPRPATGSRSTPRRPTSSACARRSTAPGVPVESAEIVDDRQEHRRGRREARRQELRLVERLEDLDDVQRVTANFDIPEELFAEVAGADVAAVIVILGIDPGTAALGYGVVERTGRPRCAWSTAGVSSRRRRRRRSRRGCWPSTRSSTSSSRSTSRTRRGRAAVLLAQRPDRHGRRPGPRGGPAGGRRRPGCRSARPRRTR